VDVLARWTERTADVYGAPPGEFEDLGTVQGINEWRFKNQAPKRVLGTWTGWLTGASFERERPDLTDAEVRAVDAAAWGVAVLAAAAALLLGWRRLRDPGHGAFLPTLAAVGALHLFAERYAWPTHFTALLPVLALASARGRWRAAGWPFVAGLLLFYGAHAFDPLQPAAAAGCLALGTLVCVLLGTGRGSAPTPLERAPREG
jgi:hypothetical protein